MLVEAMGRGSHNAHRIVCTQHSMPLTAAHCVCYRYPDPIVSYKNWRGHFREGDYLLHFPGTFCGLSPSGVYTDLHLLGCLHRFTIHFVAAM